MKQTQLAIDQLRHAVLRMPQDKLSARRAAAVARLDKHGLPTVHHEDWKYTDLEAAVNTSNRWLAAGANNATSNALLAHAATIKKSMDANWIVITNGAIDVSGISNIGAITFELLSESGAHELANKPLADLNAALLSDGLRIQIHAATEKPLGILIVDAAETSPAVSQAHLEIEIAAGCDAEIIEYHSSIGNEDSYCNSIVSLNIDESARASYVRVQDRHMGHTQTARLSVAIGADGDLQMAAFDLGGGLVRNDVDIDLSAPRANVEFNGLYLAAEGQHIDNHTRVDHRVGPATSSQEYRGILNGRCRCVWNGKAIVHKGADGTDANQANHNLLLSDKAEIDAKPELEIYADEVKCSHGTTVGQLDETALYYLRTRGMDKRQATEVLTRAFGAGLVNRIPIASIREAIGAQVEKKLAVLIQDQMS
jgi:Fe-S cluster assembly protein SufD